MIPTTQFLPKPGLINKEGFLPDPLELVSIEVPKVFDECLIKRCLKYQAGPDTEHFDEELRSNPIASSKIFLGCRDFNIKLLSVDKTPLRDFDGYSRLIINFVISFFADYLDSDGNHKEEFFEINRTESIPKLYCPDLNAKYASTLTPNSENFQSDFLKLELVAECLDGNFVLDNNNLYLDITLGFHLIVKYEILVQLLVPAYGYPPVPRPCKPIPIEDPCRKFNRTEAPKFYPDQKLKPLFDDGCEDDCDDFIDDDCNFNCGDLDSNNVDFSSNNIDF